MLSCCRGWGQGDNKASPEDKSNFALSAVSFYDGPRTIREGWCKHGHHKKLRETNAFAIEGTQHLGSSNSGKDLGKACWEEWGQ